jgi:HSP20 family molecular chaperone IbpA
MDNFFLEFEELRGKEKEKWERHKMLIELFEKGVEIEEIAKIAGLSEEEIDEFFPKLY